MDDGRNDNADDDISRVPRLNPILVTPAMASRWLLRNGRNRKLNRQYVAKLVADYRNGDAHITHQAVAFFEDGSLADGQHRLTAIVESGVAVHLIVFKGVPLRSAVAIDDGIRRHLSHSMQILSGSDVLQTRRGVAIVRVLLAMHGLASPTNDMIIHYERTHRAVITRGIRVSTGLGTKFSSAPLVAAYICALAAGVDESQVRRFVEVVSGDAAEGRHESGAVRLREWLIGNKIRSGGMDVVPVYRVQNAISSFINGVEVRQLKALSGPVWMAPELPARPNR